MKPIDIATGVTAGVFAAVHTKRAPLRSERRAEAEKPATPEPKPKVIPSTLGHLMLEEGTYWQDDEYGPGWEAKTWYLTDDPTKAEWVSSKLGGGMHAPILDIDYPAMVLPSTTEGHSHLYLGVTMSWRVYKQLLKALARAGVIENSWVGASIPAGQTMLVPPWRNNPTVRGADYGFITRRHRMLKTVYWSVSGDGYSPPYYGEDLGFTDDRNEAKFVSSRVLDGSGQNAPALDIDFPARLVPSSTPGHFHLYLDVEMTWTSYRRLLKALAKAGVIEKSWAKASIASGNTILSVPWRNKPKAASR